MTRLQASTFTIALLQLLLAFSSSMRAAAFSFRARHDGKSHKNNFHKEIDARQEIPNVLFVGVETISSPSDEQLGIISAMDAADTGGPTIPSMTGMDAAPSDRGATITSFAPPFFPSTVLQIPIYTICPGTPGYINATAPYPNATAAGNATDYPPPTLSALPVTLNATALLSNGSYTTFLRQSLSTPGFPTSASAYVTPAPDARIILGNNGCQTLYSALTTQICSTVITRGGQVPISVTDCSQWVTFSSSSSNGASVGEVCNCLDTAAVTLTDMPAAPTSPTDGGLVSEITTPAAESATLGLGIAFYAAPWYEIASGIVPGLVQVASCMDHTENNCIINSESWRVSMSTSTSTSTWTLQYAGHAIFTQLERTLTTSVSYSKVHVSTNTLLIPTIVKAALVGVQLPGVNIPSVTAKPGIPLEKTITVQMTVPQMRTWELEPIHETPMSLVREIVTVTVPGTVERVRTVTKVVGT